MNGMWLKTLLLLLSGVCFRTTLAAETESLIVLTTIRSRFAETTIHSLFVNSGKTPREVEFEVLLPHEAFVTAYSLNVDGKWYDGRVEERTKAAKLFNISRERGVAAGLLQSEVTSIKTFKTRTNLEPGSTVEFRLIYQQLLRRINGKYRHEIILIGSELTKELEVEVDICESKPIKNVRALHILSGEGTLIKPNALVEQGKYSNSASVRFLPPDNKKHLESLLKSGGRFVVEYEMEPDRNGTLIVNNGNFIQFFAPPVDIKPRRVMFLLDISGSMSGRKLSYMKKAVNNIIRLLTEEDHFGIIAFNTEFSVWKWNSKRINSGTKANIESAIGFVKKLQPTGFTEFYGPIVKAITILGKDVREDLTGVDPKSNYIVLITDGRPSANPDAEVDENLWLRNISRINKKRFAIHAVGIGKDVDNKEMSRLTAENGGTWRQLSVEINTAIQIQTYLEELGTTLLSDISLSHPDVVTSRTILEPIDLGGEYIITGSVDSSAIRKQPNVVTIRDGKSGKVTMSIEFDVENIDLDCPHVEPSAAAEFTEKAHGLATVMDTLRLIDLAKNDKHRRELRQVATELAKRYSLVTPLTSMIVLRPEDRRMVEIRYRKTIPFVPTTQVPATVATTMATWAFRGDPHVFVHLRNDLILCFQVPGMNGQIFNFLHDPMLGITVNGKVSGRKGDFRGVFNVIRSLFITEVAVVLRKEGIMITLTPHSMTTQKLGPSFKHMRRHLPIVSVEDYQISHGHVTISVQYVLSSETIVYISSQSGFKLKFILLRKSENMDNMHIDMQVFGTENLSPNVGGIFGSLPRNKLHNETEVHIKRMKHDVVLLQFRDKLIRAKQGRNGCWNVLNLHDLLGADMDTFRVNSMGQNGRQKKNAYV